MASPPPALLAGQLELVRPPAPGPLELVRRFINTAEPDRGIDAIATPAALAAWLREHGVLEAGVEPSAADVARAAKLREQLRALARGNNGCACDRNAAAAGLETAGTRSKFTMAFDAVTGSSALVPSARGIDGALGRIVAAVHVSMLEKTWPRLKACADDTCTWAYYDHSKNGCSRWCSAETCGNRSKVKRYRERQAKSAP